MSCGVLHDELFSAVQGSLTDAVFDRTTWTKLLELNGLELTLDPADVRGATVPFEEFYDNFVDLTSDDVTSSPSVPEGDADTHSTVCCQPQLKKHEQTSIIFAQCRFAFGLSAGRWYGLRADFSAIYL